MSEKPKRPGVVLAAAIILFVFGGIAVAEIAGAVFPYLASPAEIEKKELNKLTLTDPTPTLVAEEPALMAVSAAFTVMGAIIGVVKIWAGAGVLRLKPSARTAGIIVAVVTILLSIMQGIHSALYVIPAYVRVFSRDNVPEIAEYAGLIEGLFWVSTGVQLIGSIALWLIVICLLNHPRSRNAFAGISDESIEETPAEPASQYSGYDDE
jgi:hypothetical protein